MKNKSEEVTPPRESGESSVRAEVASDSLTENAISTEAIDFEDSSFVEKNKHAGTHSVKSDTIEEKDNIDEYEKSFLDKPTTDDSDCVAEELTTEQQMDKVIREIAEQPFEVAMNNLEVAQEDVVSAAEGVFSSKGYFEKEFSLPFNGAVTMRSKSVNDYVDYSEYVRRLLLDPISQKEFDTFTQIRNLAYAIVVIDGDDISHLPVEERFDMLRKMSEIKITAIINNTKSFWRVTHLLLHPGLVDFLAHMPEE